MFGFYKVTTVFSTYLGSQHLSRLNAEMGTISREQNPTIFWVFNQMSWKGEDGKTVGMMCSLLYIIFKFIKMVVLYLHMVSPLRPTLFACQLGKSGGPIRARAKVESSLRLLSRWARLKSINWVWLNRPFDSTRLYIFSRFGSSWRMVYYSFLVGHLFSLVRHTPQEEVVEKGWASSFICAPPILANYRAVCVW